MRCTSGIGRGASLAWLLGLLATTSCNDIFGIEPGVLTSGSGAGGTGAGGSGATGGTGGMATGGSGGLSTGSGASGPCGPVAAEGKATGWVKQAIGNYSDRALAMARQPSGGLLVGGFYSDADFVVDLDKLPYGNYPDEPGEREDVFIARYKPDGKPDWAIGFAARDTQRVVTMASDPSGNALVGGYFLDTFPVGTTTLTSDAQILPVVPDGFVFKLDAAGAPLWAKQFGGPSIDEVRGVASDSAGNVYVLGVSVLGGEIASPPASATVQYGCGASTLGKDVQRVFLTKLGPQGNCLWDRQYEIDTRFYGVNNEPAGLALTVDPDDNVIVVGGFADVANFGGGVAVVAAGGKDVFVLKASPAGEPIWAAAYGDSNLQAATVVAADPQGDLWIGGTCTQSLTLDPLPIQVDPLADPDHTKGFVAKLQLDPDPTLPAKPVFAQALWDTGWQELRAVATNAQGDVAFGGNAYAFQGASGIDFGDGEKILPSSPDGNGNANYDGFVASYCKSGGLRWSRRFGTGESELVFGVALDDAGHTFVTGSFDGKYNFGGAQSYTPVGEDVFTLRLGP